MKFFKLLAVFLIAAFMISGCKNKGAGEQAEAPAAPLGAGTAAPQDTNIGASHTTPKTDDTIAAGSVAKAEGGYTVEELFLKKAELAGQNVSVHGKVVKFSEGIMGSNWIHIQDGSGNSVEGTNDLTVTTQGSAAVDSLVTVSGALVADKDFGAGYKYSIIIENADVKAD
jgi:hypothetical protein